MPVKKILWLDQGEIAGGAERFSLDFFAEVTGEEKGLSSRADPERPEGAEGEDPGSKPTAVPRQGDGSRIAPEACLERSRRSRVRDDEGNFSGRVRDDEGEERGELASTPVENPSNIQHQKSNIHLLLATPNPYSSFARAAGERGIRVVETPLPKLPPAHFRRFFRAVLALRRLVKTEQPELIVSNTVRGHLITGAAFFFSRRKVVWLLHDFFFSPTAGPRLSSFFLRLVARVPKKIGALPAVRQQLKEKLPRLFAKSLEIINGVAPPVKTSPFPPREAGELRVGFAGRLTPGKGPEDFLAAAELFAAKEPRARFFLAGEGELASILAARIASSKILAGRVELLGFVEKNFDFLAGLDILVHPARVPETFGRVPLEALALGKAVVATAIGFPREMIRDGETGFLVPPRNPAFLAAALEKLAREPGLRERLGEAGRGEVLEKFSRGRAAGVLLEGLGEVKSRLSHHRDHQH